MNPTLTHPLTGSLPDFCPTHSRAESHAKTRRLGVYEGWIIFADGCRQSQRTGEVISEFGLYGHFQSKPPVIAEPADSASSEPLPSPGKAPLQIVK